jgi:hypothetical protein
MVSNAQVVGIASQIPLLDVFTGRILIARGFVRLIIKNSRDSVRSADFGGHLISSAISQPYKIGSRHHSQNVQIKPKLFRLNFVMTRIHDPYPSINLLSDTFAILNVFPCRS